MTDDNIVSETPEPDLIAEVARLAKLSPLEYDRQRDDAASLLNVRVKTLDTEVCKLRVSDVEEDAAQVVEEINPWHEPINGTELLNEIQRLYRRHCILEDKDYLVMPVLALATYVFDAFAVFPKVLVKSPEKRCGKTVLLEVSEAVVYRGMMASSITASAIFRIIDAHHPTLIIDEADAFMVGNEEMRGVINSSHRKRSAFVVRTEKLGEEFVPKKFTTWAPVFIAGIGSQADTIEDRSVIVNLRRKATNERVAKYPVDLVEQKQTLRRMCLRWAEDNIDRLKLADFEMPDCGNDRAADNWFPLFAITRVIGEPWRSQIEAAYYSKNAITEDEGIGAMLLRDIRDIFDGKRWTRMHTSDLVEKLVEMENRPWPEWRRGNPMTATSLGKLLKPYKIKSRQLKIHKVNRYGYERTQFEDAWNRYVTDELGGESLIPPLQNATTLPPLLHKALRGIQNATRTPSVAFLKSLKPLQDGAGSEVAFLEGVAVDPTATEERF